MTTIETEDAGDSSFSDSTPFLGKYDEVSAGCEQCSSLAQEILILRRQIPDIKNDDINTLINKYILLAEYCGKLNKEKEEMQCQLEFKDRLVKELQKNTGWRQRGSENLTSRIDSSIIASEFTVVGNDTTKKSITQRSLSEKQIQTPVPEDEDEDYHQSTTQQSYEEETSAVNPEVEEAQEGIARNNGASPTTSEVMCIMELENTTIDGNLNDMFGNDDKSPRTNDRITRLTNHISKLVRELKRTSTVLGNFTMATGVDSDRINDIVRKIVEVKEDLDVTLCDYETTLTHLTHPCIERPALTPVPMVTDDPLKQAFDNELKAKQDLEVRVRELLHDKLELQRDLHKVSQEFRNLKATYETERGDWNKTLLHLRRERIDQDDMLKRSLKSVEDLKNQLALKEEELFKKEKELCNAYKDDEDYMQNKEFLMNFLSGIENERYKIVSGDMNTSLPISRDRLEKIAVKYNQFKRNYQDLTNYFEQFIAAITRQNGDANYVPDLKCPPCVHDEAHNVLMQMFHNNMETGTFVNQARNFIMETFEKSKETDVDVVSYSVDGNDYFVADATDVLRVLNDAQKDSEILVKSVKHHIKKGSNCESLERILSLARDVRLRVGAAHCSLKKRPIKNGSSVQEDLSKLLNVLRPSSETRSR